MRIHQFTGSIVLAALAVAVLTAGCGGDDGGGDGDGDATKPAATQQATQAATQPAQPTSAAESVDVCALVTKADVEAAIGAPVLDGKPDQAANLYTCSFAEPEFANISAAGVAVFVELREGEAKEVYDLAKSNAAEVQPVDGIGDEAYWDSILNTMQVLSGKYEISIDVASEEGRDQVAAAKAIGSKAIAGLP